MSATVSSHQIRLDHDTSLDPTAADLCSTYAERGFVVAPRVFSGDGLGLICQSLRAILEKSGDAHADSARSLDELILDREASDHSLVYKAAQSLGSSAATYQLLGSSGVLDLVCRVTGFRKSDLHLMPMYLIVQLPSVSGSTIVGTRMEATTPGARIF